MPFVFALSVSDQIEKIGSYAGFAAIVGLAVLALLYFAQAREVKRLREWAGRAPERAQELEQRVTQQAEMARQAAEQRRVVAQPIQRPQPAAAPVPAPAVAAAPAPAAPVLPSKPGTPIPAIAVVAAAAAKAKPAVATPPPAPATPAPATPASTPAPVPAGQPAPATVAGGATVATTPAPAVAPGSNGTGERAAVPPPPPPPERAAALRSSSPSATIPPRTPSQSPRRAEDGGHRRRNVGVIIGALLAAGAAAAVILVVMGGDDGTKAPNVPGQVDVNGTQTTTSKSKSGAKPVPRSSVTVAVLNGTTVNGLAASVADRLAGVGFKKGAAVTAPDQTRSATIVQYAPGFKDEARDVARVLKVNSDAILALDQATKAVACGSGACPDVVVTVGADRTD